MNDEFRNLIDGTQATSISLGDAQDNTITLQNLAEARAKLAAMVSTEVKK